MGKGRGSRSRGRGRNCRGAPAVAAEPLPSDTFSVSNVAGDAAQSSAASQQALKPKRDATQSVERTLFEKYPSMKKRCCWRQ